jgi:trans-aconitate methyltransferase
MTDWNSALYMKFENERTRAARDLVAQIPAFNPSSIFDLGCGPGNGTIARAMPVHPSGHRYPRFRSLVAMALRQGPVP